MQIKRYVHVKIEDANGRLVLMSKVKSIYRPACYKATINNMVVIAETSILQCQIEIASHHFHQAILRATIINRGYSVVKVNCLVSGVNNKPNGLTEFELTSSGCASISIV